MKSDFSFFIDDIILEKAGTDEQGREIMKIGGIATTSAKDTDGEEIDPMGWETDYFDNLGFFNYNHQAKTNPSAVIGEPTKTEIRPDGLYLEGFLYPESELARSVYDTIEMLKKSSSNRRMGFSIEGQALERDPLNPKKIKKARLTGCALTLNPKNPNTLVDIIKGEYSDPLPRYEFTEVSSSALTENNTLIHLEVDGRVVEIKKDLSICITPMKTSVDKSLTTDSGSATVVESVDRELKNKEKIDSEEKFLTKGEVYSEIFNYIYPHELEKADLIYQMIGKLHEKQMKMNKDKSAGIKKSDIEKSLDAILNSNVLEKSVEATVVGQPEGENGISITETTANSTKGEPGGGEPGNVSKSEDELEKEFDDDEKYKQLKEKMKKAQDEFDNYVGSKKTKIEKAGTLKKEDDGEGESDDMLKSINSSLGKTNDLMKSLALVTKGMLRYNETLETENRELKKSLDNVLVRVENIENTPIPSKTVTATDYRPHPRLEKSIDGGSGTRVLDIRRDKGEILEMLDRKSGLDTDNPDMRYAQSMASFETTNYLDKAIARELEKSEGVEIVGL